MGAAWPTLVVAGASLLLLLITRPRSLDASLPNVKVLQSRESDVVQLRSYTAPVDAVLEGCGDVCRTNMTGRPGKYFDIIEKRVDCMGLMTNAAIDGGFNAAGRSRCRQRRVCLHLPCALQQRQKTRACHQINEITFPSTHTTHCYKLIMQLACLRRNHQKLFQNTSWPDSRTMAGWQW